MAQSHSQRKVPFTSRPVWIGPMAPVFWTKSVATRARNSTTQCVSVHTGVAKGGGAGLRQQAGHQGLYVGRGDLSAAQPDVHQRPRLAHPGVLRPHWGGVGIFSGMYLCAVPSLGRGKYLFWHVSLCCALTGEGYISFLACIFVLHPH